MTDPLQPSPERQARDDQLRAAIRELADPLRQMVDELVADGWTDEQARQLVVHAITYGSRS